MATETIEKIVIFATLTVIVALLTLVALDTWQTVLLTLLLLILVHYVIILGVDRLAPPTLEGVEGFESPTEALKSTFEWKGNDDLFDDFYASVFTKLTQNENLIQAETALCLEEFAKTTPKAEMRVLDAGCGIGIATCAFAKQGVGHTVGIDKSAAMIRYAKTRTLPSTTLTPTERQDVEFRQADLIGPSAAEAAEFTDAVVLYFTIYYFPDLEGLFRNLAYWVRPGGSLAVEVVNKHKFEPILDSCNPLVGISPQKYVSDRLTRSKVVFDQFEYEAAFELEDPRAEFRETFRFKDGSVRRQKHSLVMPSISEIVKAAQRGGWSYTSYVDMMPMSFPYGYLLFFKRDA
jgi:SAM-dependent methyltransferase